MLARLLASLGLAAGLLSAMPASAYDVVDKELGKERGFDRVKVRLGGFVQPRFRFEPVDEAAGSPGQLGFTVQRARLELAGDLLADPEKRWGFSIRQKYSLELVGRNGAVLQDAYVNFGFGTEFQLRVGQFKAPVHRANLVSDSNNLFPDKNRITQFSGLPNRDIGVMFHGYWGDRQVGWAAGVWNGEGANRIASNRKMLYVGRLWVAPLGSPGDSYEILKDWQPPNREKDLPAFSVGYSFHTFTDGTPGEEQFWMGHNVEGFFHWKFVTVMSELFLRRSDWERTDIADFNQRGWYVQLGAFLYKVPWAEDHLALMTRIEQGDEFDPIDADVPPTGALDPAQATRRYAVGLGIYAGQPLFRFVQDLRVVASYTIKDELEGFDVNNNEFNLSMNLTF